MDPGLEEEVNNHIRENYGNLKNEYSLKDADIDIMYNNIEMILDKLVNFYQAPKKNYSAIGNAWRVITSQYFEDVLCMYDKYPDYQIRKMYTREVDKYFRKMLKMIKEEEKDDNNGRTV